MPIQVRVSVNHQEVATLHIGRDEEFVGHDVEHKYIVVDHDLIALDGMNSLGPDWGNGYIFGHKYSDGLLVCVERAIVCYNENTESKEKQ